MGYSLGGMNIYNALEGACESRCWQVSSCRPALADVPPLTRRRHPAAGFSSSNGPTVCTTSGYYCAGGADIETCINELTYTCGTSGAASLAVSVASSTFGDACAGHADPYHFHTDLKCEYSPSSTASASSVTAHSPLIGIALDGKARSAARFRLGLTCVGGCLSSGGIHLGRFHRASTACGKAPARSPRTSTRAAATSE